MSQATLGRGGGLDGGGGRAPAAGGGEVAAPEVGFMGLSFAPEAVAAAIAAIEDIGDVLSAEGTGKD